METRYQKIRRLLHSFGLSDGRPGRDFKARYFNVNGRRELNHVVLYGTDAAAVVQQHQGDLVEAGFTVKRGAWIE